MQHRKSLLSLAVLLIASCQPSEEVEEARRDALTKAQFSAYISAIKIYEKEYEAPIPAPDSIEFAKVLEGKNEKEIRIYRFPEESRNEEGEILDAHGNPIKFRNEESRIIFHSFGRNGVMDSFPGNDDIIMHYESKAQQVGTGQPM